MNNKRLKLPNGFGSITKKSGRRRKPFEIRKWIDGKQKVIGYEVTYESALAFLCEYNKNPLLFSPSEITFDELFCLVKAYLYPRIKERTQSSYNCAYKHLNRLYDKQFAKKTLIELNIKYHTPHECRHTLASLLNNVGANITASKRILGHASNDITEKHYTHKDLHQLKKAMDLIVFKY